MTALLITNLAATVFLAAIAWSLQFVQLPMLTEENASRHRRLNTRLVIGPMIVEAFAAVWLFLDTLHGFAVNDLRSELSMFAFLCWGQSAFWTGFYTYQHSRPFDGGKLSRINLARAIGWTTRTAILICIMMK